MPRLILAVLLLLGLTAPGSPGRAQEIPPTPRPDTPQPARDAVVANDTERLMQEIYLYPAGSTDPGRDRLGNAVLPQRALLRIALPRGVMLCAYEVRVVFDDGNEERRRLDVCRGARATFSDAGPRRDLSVVNDGDVEVRELYLWPSNRPAEPGPDRLGTRTVPVGETLALRLRGTAECVFDLRAVFADDSEEKRQRLDLCRTPRLGFGDPSLPVREAKVANRARLPVRELYARAVGQEAWGADRLGSATLDARAEFTLRIRSRDCRFDLRAVYENDREELLPGRDLCAEPAVALAGPAPAVPGELRRLQLVNGYQRTINQVFLAATEPDGWGDDLLGDGVLAPGARQEVSVTSGCRADLRIVFDSDAAEERRAIDLCAASLVLLRPGWTVAERLDAAEPAVAPQALASPQVIPPAAVPPAIPPVIPQTAPPAAPPAIPSATPLVTPPAPAAVTSLVTPPAAPPGPVPVPGRVRLRNFSALPVVEFYADPPGAPRGEDRLGRGVLPAGGVLEFPTPPGLGQGAEACRADLTAVFRDGRHLRLAGFNLCSGEEVVLQ